MLRRPGGGEAGGATVGFASYRLTSQETVPVVYLLELQIEPPYRRQGLGSLLLRTVRGLRPYPYPNPIHTQTLS